MEMAGSGLLEYACEKFEKQMYEEALEAFVLTYEKGYEPEWVLENIYNCYMAGNEDIFRESFRGATAGKDISYEECILDFIPYKDGEYFIFDKELCMFRGIFSADELKEAKPDDVFTDIEFSGAALVLDWDFRKKKSVIAEAKNRKIYLVCRDIKRCLSFWKIPELKSMLENIVLFADYQEFQSYFHANTSVYLPRIMFGNEEQQEQLNKIWKEEHKYRLTPQGRNAGNVLLTIGIPTHDRGNLLLDKLEHLQKLPYDAEIEFAISKNGTHFYQEEYEKVETIPDARIHYAGYNREITMSKNWQNVIQMAHGKFVLLVSDEDYVIEPALEHYLKLLSSHGRLAFVRPRTVVQYAYVISKNCYLKKGKDAFLGGFLVQNYLSGGIYNRELFLEADIGYWNETYGENSFYQIYPHMWWQVLLAFLGDYATDTVYLINEGEAQIFDEIKKYREMGAKEQELIDNGMDEDAGIAYLSTYEGRIKQFQGCVQLIHDFKKLDKDMKAEALWSLINKTGYLMTMVYVNYHHKRKDFPDWLVRLAYEAVSAMEDMNIDDKNKDRIAALMQNMLEDIKITIFQELSKKGE